MYSALFENFLIYVTFVIRKHSKEKILAILKEYKIWIWFTFSRYCPWKYAELVS